MSESGSHPNPAADERIIAETIRLQATPFFEFSLTFEEAATLAVAGIVGNRNADAPEWDSVPQVALVARKVARCHGS